MQKEKYTPKTDIWTFRYNEYKDTAETENDVLQDPSRDLTKELDNWLNYKIKRKKLINCHVRANVTEGKSTFGIWLQYRINKLLIDNKTYGGKYPLEKMDKYIFGDQTDFTRLARTSGKLGTQLAALIDEVNILSFTGVNSSLETAVFQHISNVFAQHYIHKITCTPTMLPDSNIDTIFEIWSTDFKSTITSIKVYYRNIVTRQEKLIGYMHMPMKNILEKPLYERYRTKKFMRMDLLSKGERNLVTMEQSLAVLTAFLGAPEDEHGPDLPGLKDLCVVTRVTQNKCISAIEISMKRLGLLFTEYAKQPMANNLYILCDTYRQLCLSTQKIQGIVPLKKTENQKTVKMEYEYNKKYYDMIFGDQLRSKKLYYEYLTIGNEE